MTPCLNCHSEAFIRQRIWVENGELQGTCDRCGDFSPTTVPDVFFKTAYKSHALGVEFTSKGQKAAYLKAHDLREAGDEKMSTTSWIDGTRAHSKRQFDQVDRPKIRETIRQWRDRARC